MNKFEGNLRKLVLDDDVRLYSQKLLFLKYKDKYKYKHTYCIMLCCYIIFYYNTLYMYTYMHVPMCIYICIHLSIFIYLSSFSIGYLIHSITEVCFYLGINSFLEPIFFISLGYSKMQHHCKLDLYPLITTTLILDYLLEKILIARSYKL